MSETKRKLEAHLEQESQLPDEGDWYCKNCGYLSSSRVTYYETCDTCHTPVEFHTVDQQTEIERVEEINAQLTADNERLRGVMWEALELFVAGLNAMTEAGAHPGCRCNTDDVHPGCCYNCLFMDARVAYGEALITPAECGGDEDV